MLNEINQTEKDKYWIVTIFGIKKKSVIETENRVVDTNGWGVGEWGDVGKGCKFLVIR